MEDAVAGNASCSGGEGFGGFLRYLPCLVQVDGVDGSVEHCYGQGLDPGHHQLLRVQTVHVTLVEDQFF